RSPLLPASRSAPLCPPWHGRASACSVPSRNLHSRRRPMSCDFPGTLLHAYLDGELDAVRAAEFERHLETCRDCTGTLGAAESLRASLQRAQLYETAPAGLRKKIRSELKISAAGASSTPVGAWRWLAVAAAILLVTGVTWFAVPQFRSDTPQSV